MIKRFPKIVRLGTRGSLLALNQAKTIKAWIEEHNPDVVVNLVPIKTKGDKIEIPLFKMGGKGLFVKEIEEALLQAEVDLAVHSAKDLPVQIPEGLSLIAFPPREDPRDALICRQTGFGNKLPEKGKVGTSSLRRQAQLRHHWPNLEIVPLRGNLDTRLRKLYSLNLDAIIVAAAGLHRLGWQEKITAYLEPEVMLPAIGQGILVVEGREGDEGLQKILHPLNDLTTQQCFLAERSFLQRVGGGCQVPIAGWARIESDKLILRGLVAAVDGQKVVRGEISGLPQDGQELGKKLAADLLARGGQEILDEVYGHK
ncbi:MAG: hydroxymethylbilane synthase [Thermodesulfobacteriota bacterium]